MCHARAGAGPAVSAFQPTAPDVDPGIDHGNSADLPEDFQKRLVFYRSQQPPGVIIVNTVERHLYLIQDPTHAIRYGIGVGREGFTWQGLLQIGRKAEWPDWHLPPEMIERQPYLPRFMAGGPGNPLGACAMYLGNTVYRIHGTRAGIGMNTLAGVAILLATHCLSLATWRLFDLTPFPIG